MADIQEVVILAAAGNGTGDPVELPAPPTKEKQMERTLYIGGVFDGASVAFEISKDGTD